MLAWPASILCLAELDKRREHGADQARAADGTLQPKAQDCANGKSSEATADLLGVSTRQVEQLRTIQDHATPAHARVATRPLPQRFSAVTATFRKRFPATTTRAGVATWRSPAPGARRSPPPPRARANAYATKGRPETSPSVTTDALVPRQERSSERAARELGVSDKTVRQVKKVDATIRCDGYNRRTGSEATERP